MRNRKFNRVTCILLALCMMASFLLNAVSALETQAPGDGMHFIFRAAGYGSETDIGYDTIKSYDDYVGGSSKTPTWATNSGDKWRIDGACSTYEVDGFYLTDADGLKKDTDGDGSVDDVYEANALSFKAKGNNAVHPTSGSNKALYYTAVAITLDVAETGNFIPSLTYHVGPEVPKCDVYLIQRSTSTVYDYRNRMSFNGGNSKYTLLASQLIRGRVKDVEGAYLGTIDMYAEKEGTQTTTFPAYEIPEGKTGEYVLFLNISNVNTAFYNKYGRGKMPDYIASIHSFDLTPAPEEEEPVISRAELALDNTSLTVGGTAKASVEFFLEDGTKYEKAVEYTLTSSDTNVATVDEKTGIVTAVAAGNACISVSLVSDTSITSSVNITVAESVYLKELIPSEKGITLYVSGAENSITLTAKAKMNDNSVQSAEKYALTFESSESGIARVESSGNIATVTAVSAGETNITISATNEKGEPCAASVPVYVKEKYDGIHFNFSAASWDKAAVADIPAEDIKANGDAASPVFASIDTDPWYIDGQRLINDYRLTSEAPDTGAYPNAKPNALYWRVKNYGYLNPVTSGGVPTGNANASLALRVKISGKGTFTPSITYEAGPTSTNYAFFLAPASAYTASGDGYRFDFRTATTEASKLNGDQYITNQKPLSLCFKDGSQDPKLIELGEQNLYAPQESRKTVNFLPVQIEEPGDYYLYMVAKGRKDDLPAKDGTYDVNLYSLDLYPYGTVEGAPVISGAELSLADTSIGVGRTTSTSVKFFTGDGTAIEKAYKYLLESSDTSVASVDNATGVITALSEGKATITAKLAIDPSVSSSAELTVTEKPTLREIVPSIRSVNLYKEGGVSTETITLQAEMSDGIIDSVDAYEITFENSDDTVITMQSDGKSAVVTAVAPGNANIIISTTNEKGDPVSASVSVTVKEVFDGVHFNFSAAGYGEKEDIPAEKVKANGDSASPAFASIDTDPWYVDGQRLINNYRITSETPDIEKFPQSRPNALYWRVYNYAYLNPVTSSGSASAALALKVKIPGAGKFTPSITYEAGPTSTRYAFFLAPVSSFTYGDAKYKFYWDSADATTDALKANGDINITNKAPLMSVFKTQNSKLIKIGEQNLYAAEPEKRTVVFDSVEIAEPGEYYLYLVARGRVDSLPVGSATSYYDVNLHSVDLYDFSNLRLVSTGAYPETGEIYEGEKIKLVHQPVLNDGRIFDHPAVITKYTSMDESIAGIEGDSLVAKAAGDVRIKVESSIQGYENNVVVGYLNVNIQPETMRKLEVTAGGAKQIRLTDKGNDTVSMFITAITSTGKHIELSDDEIKIEALTPEFATIVNGRDILPVSEGQAKFVVTATHGGATVSQEVQFPVIRGKSEASYMTAEKAAAARENAQKYDWAKSTAETYARQADKYVDKIDQLWDLIVSEGIPRSFTVGLLSDPDATKCRYCNTNLQTKYGSNPWLHNPFTRPWQIQCPDCKRLFPSNDFGSFYKLGLNEYGEFDRMRALNAHRELYGDKSVTEPGIEHSAQWKAYYGYGNPNGFLYNKLYQEIGDKDENGNYKVKTINAGKGLREGETVDTWGVDDGDGYVPTHSDGTPYKHDENGVQERHPYIAEYLFYGVWRGSGVITGAINSCANAYFYTGDVKYGRVAAILLDRLADFYPQYDTRLHKGKAAVSAGGTSVGKLVGRIWDTAEATGYIESYDKVFDMYEDEYVLDYIAQKSKQYKMRYAKETPSQIRTSIEDGLLRESFRSIKAGLIKGNDGMHEKTNAIVAVVLDSKPETDEWLDYLNSTGGFYSHLVDVIDNDGQAQEGSHYNTYQLDNLRGINAIFESNDKYFYRNFANHPKYIKMHYANIPIMSTYYTPQMGDSHSTAAKGHWTKTEEALSGWKLTGDPIFAQVLYLLNGNKTEGLKYSIFEKDPESLEVEVENVIKEQGTLNLTSEMMPHFGFAMLRYGVDNTGGVGTTAQDTRRDVWMYYGSNNWSRGSHGHYDSLNLGMTAYGLNLLPDLGYPSSTTSSEAKQWTSATISHNTVVVNGESQVASAEPRGEAYHFDDDGTVSLMDVEASYVYKATDSYRRSVVNVKVDDENAYAVDFFRVLGGNEHLYSFHVQGDEINETAGLDFTVVEDENGNYISGSQLDENGNYKGTYVGRDAKYVKNTQTGAVRAPVEGEVLGENEVLLDVEHGPDPYSPSDTFYTTVFPRGYTWFDRIDRDTSPEDKFEVDFAIKDFKKALKVKKDISLRITMFNASNIAKGATASVAIANGYPPSKESNNEIPSLKYLLVENRGNNLDTVFTSVIEPYSGERYLESSDELPMQVIGDVPENEGDAHRAVKVKHVDGRVDYILWSTNNKVTYEITLEDGTPLSFRGFVGVYTVQNGRCTYQFLNDGDILGETKNVQGAIEGTVKEFTKVTDPKGIELPFENEIVITLNSPREYTEKELQALKNKYIYVDNGLTTRSGTYKIEGVTQSGDDLIVDVGIVTLVRKYVDASDFTKGFVYTIEEGQSARIPLTVSQNSDPIFAPVNKELTTSAGSSITVQVSAHSPIEDAPPTISYEGTVLPRGASLNSETGVVTWKPTGSQVGENHFAITAHDSDGRESTVHFNVTVYGSTTGKPSDTTTETPSTGNAGTTGGDGGGGGGGGAAPTDKPDEENKTDETNDDESLLPEEKVPSGDEADEVENGDNDNIRFTDLGNHEWASDAINTLAEDGIIKGTSASTYSPANNITRADFALLLVRAFKLTSDSTENFADVSANDYFAAELAIARNSGIVNGIGDNKYAPRNTITRQDMMVIVYRALQSQSLPLEGSEAQPNVGEDNKSLPLEGKGDRRMAVDEVSYPDFDTVAEYAKTAVSALIGAGIVNGKNGRIAPTDYTTRAEVAVLIKRILDYIK
ncbi:MAG: S-layer homology domain-containing protein [Oscillospiraceae bacterium]|nr:S-layer homology domain-containing protein [Oscillospiraceae bacterium]